MSDNSTIQRQKQTQQQIQIQQQEMVQTTAFKPQDVMGPDASVADAGAPPFVEIPRAARSKKSPS
jgi:hypothetical protein